jgi:hypothetical protein
MTKKGSTWFVEMLFHQIVGVLPKSALANIDRGSAKICEPERAGCCWKLCFRRGQFLQDAQQRQLATNIDKADR